MGIPFHFETAHSFGLFPIVEASNHAAAKDEIDGRHDCGSCHACCIHLPIPAGEVGANGKPAGVPCPHLVEHGCKIYAERPATCRQFQCVWITEPTWPLAWRPEQSGLLCLREEIDTGIFAALAYEIQIDAISRPSTESILTKLKESTAVIALVNLQRQRRLLRGRQWVEHVEHSVRRPHFLKPIHAVGAELPEGLRDAS